MVAQPGWVVFRFIPITNDNPSIPNKLFRQYNVVIYLQSAYLLADETTIEREYSALDAIQDHYEKILVSMDEFNFPNRNGIKHVQAWNLSEYIS